ncbi:uncharacterized protein PFL1_03475 [Pseudozyma flocculosa PF-1]|nr:uncharacterized protein PFL1_03475 [Pseudozyma flocculosa PF-1]EPQ29188.1 hypothetical protein PFL1_03475 [Pseudozyma flocculosa PF-1]
MALPPAFTKLPLDVYYDALTFQEQDKHGKVWRDILQQLPFFGRPLLGNRHVKFSSGHDPSKTQLEPLVGDVSLAKLQARLVFDREITLLPDLSSVSDGKLSADAMDRYLAALSQRVPLLFIGLQGNLAIELFLQRQVSTHFRTIVKIVPSTSLIITATPSEPLLSIAATDLFRKQLGKAAHGVLHRWRDSIRIIRRFRKFYGFTAGLDGEEMARLLLTMATDISSVDELEAAAEAKRIARDRSKVTTKCVDGDKSGGLTESGEEDDSEIRAELWRNGMTLQPLTLWSWLVVLLGDAVVRATAFSVPEGRASATRSKRVKSDFEAFARSARITFTHFVRLPNNIRDVSKRQLSQWFAEHVAIFGAERQESWDLLIPVYVDDSCNGPDTIIDITKFSFVVIQVKNRNALVPPEKTRIDPPTVLEEPHVQDSGSATLAGTDSSRDADGAKSNAPEPLEYLSIFMQLNAVLSQSQKAVSYSCSQRGKMRAHELQAIGIEHAFGEMLRRLDKRTIDDAYVLLGTNRSTLVFEEEAYHRQKGTDIDPRVAYGRAHKSPPGAPA